MPKGVRYWPMRPLRPHVMSRATPPTTGGRTRGTVSSARTQLVARCSERARNQARGVPSSRHRTAVTDVVVSESRSAGRTVGVARSDGMRAQSARSSSATSGTTSRSSASAAGTPSATRERHRAAYLMSGHPAGGRTGRRSGRAEAERLHGGEPLGAQQVGDEGVAGGVVGQRDDRVGEARVELRGDLDARDGVLRRDDVGVVDHGSVGLGELDLGEGRLDVELLAHDVGHDPGLGEGGLRGFAARHGVGAEDDLDARLREVVDRGDRAGVARGDGDLEDVGREGLRVLDHALVQWLGRGRAGEGDDRGGRTVVDLLHEGRAGAVGGLDGDPRVGRLEVLLQLVERLGQGRCGEDRDGALEGGRRDTGLPRLPGAVGGRRGAAAAGEEHGGGSGEGGDGGREGVRGLREGSGKRRAHAGTSTTTWVDLTLATATEPTSSARSSTDSLESSETMRNGPHWSSTLAMTVSFVMAVTMPRIRLRADAPPMVPTAAGCASSWATAASWAPSTVRRPASSVDPSRRPESTMRRTVSSETPRREAASVIRRCGMTVTLHPHLRTWSACVCRVRDSTATARWVGREARRKGG